MDAAKGNELIDAINDLTTSRGVGGIQVTAEANGRLVISAEDLGGAEDDGEWLPTLLYDLETGKVVERELRAREIEAEEPE